MNWFPTSTRAHLCQADYEFLRTIFKIQPKENWTFDAILEDENTQNSLLDNKLLYEIIAEQQGYLNISPALYFYVLIRKILRDDGIENRDIADYISGVLTRHLTTQNAFSHPITQGQTFFYLSDFLNKLEEAKPAEEFFLRVQYADYSLFITGLFPEHLIERTNRKAAPDINFYESIASLQYEIAGKHCLAEEFQLNQIFSFLSNDFTIARNTLHKFSTLFSNHRSHFNNKYKL